jgi:hypothetical protein
MRNALILHGAGNNSRGNWFPWLKTELENKGYQVWTPDLPGSDRPVQKVWLETVFANREWKFNQDSRLIGHSAGATLILRILERLPDNVTVSKAVLVACPIDKGEIPEYFQYKEDLTRAPFDWVKIRKSCRNFYFIASDNDPYDCGERHAVILREKLGGKLIIQAGQGHFNLEAAENYREFPLLLDLIR